MRCAMRSKIGKNQWSCPDRVGPCDSCGESLPVMDTNDQGALCLNCMLDSMLDEAEVGEVRAHQ